MSKETQKRSLTADQLNDRIDSYKSLPGRKQQQDIHDNDGSDVKVPDVKVSNIIGDFGPYQIAVVLFAALRAMCCAMDGLSGPFLSPDIKQFKCDICDPSSASYVGNFPANNITNDGVCRLVVSEPIKTHYEIDTSQCYFNNADSPLPDRIGCNKWSFNNTYNERLMNSLTIEQSLVCDREWLKSLSNSMYFVGATFGLLFWGVISDRYGRKTAYICSHFVTLIFGFASLFANTMPSYIILRAINAFGMIGELIPRSIQVEIVATEYRFVCSVICQIGWATGIILVPALAYFNPSYRFILSFPVIVSALMLPWLLYLPESSRWLIANQNFKRARNELRKAARINGKLNDDTDSKIEQFNRQVLREEIGQGPKKRIGVGRSILAIFTNALLLKDTMSVFVLLFVAEVVYFSLTLNVADLGGSLYINYVISGLSELVSIAFCALILAYLPRRTCLSLLLLASTVSYLLMALSNVYQDYLSMTIILGLNAFAKLTAIGNLMVIILVSQEVFPTVIRQFGTSLCITVGKAGSAVAPFTHELGQIIGQSYCFAMFSLICLICALIPFCLSETGDRELPDTVIDVEEGASSKKKGSKKSQKLNNGYNKTSQHQDSDHAGFAAHYESNRSIAKLQNINDFDSNNNNNNDDQLMDYNMNKNLAVNVFPETIDGVQSKQVKQDINRGVSEEDLNNNNLGPKNA